MTPNQKLIQAALTCDVEKAKEAFAEGADVNYVEYQAGITVLGESFAGITSSALVFCTLSKEVLRKKFAFLQLLLQQPSFDPAHENQIIKRIDIENNLPGYCRGRNAQRVTIKCYSPIMIMSLDPNLWMLTLYLLIKNPALKKYSNHNTVVNTNVGRRAQQEWVFSAESLVEEPSRQHTKDFFKLFDSITIADWQAALAYLQNDFCFDDPTHDPRAEFWLMALNNNKCLISYDENERLKDCSITYGSISLSLLAAELGHNDFFVCLFEKRAEKVPYEHVIILAKNFVPKSENDEDLFFWYCWLDVYLHKHLEANNFVALSLYLFCTQSTEHQQKIINHLQEHFDIIFTSTTEVQKILFLGAMMTAQIEGLQKKLKPLLSRILTDFPKLFSRICLTLGKADLVQFLLSQGADPLWRDDAGKKAITAIIDSGLPRDEKITLVNTLHAYHADLSDPKDPNLIVKLTELGFSPLQSLTESFRHQDRCIVQNAKEIKQATEVFQSTTSELTTQLLSIEQSARQQFERVQYAIGSHQEIFLRILPDIEQLSKKMMLLERLALQFQAREKQVLSSLPESSTPLAITNTSSSNSVNENLEKRVDRLEEENKSLKQTTSQQQDRINQLENKLDEVLGLLKNEKQTRSQSPKPSGIFF